MKPFKHEIRKKKWDKLRKRRLLQSLLIGGCSALVFAGAGAGIGYAIWHKKKSSETTPIKLKITQSAPLVLKKMGDFILFTLEWNDNAKNTLKALPNGHERWYQIFVDNNYSAIFNTTGTDKFLTWSIDVINTNFANPWLNTSYIDDGSAIKISTPRADVINFPADGMFKLGLKLTLTKDFDLTDYSTDVIDLNFKVQADSDDDSYQPDDPKNQFLYNDRQTRHFGIKTTAPSAPNVTPEIVENVTYSFTNATTDQNVIDFITSLFKPHFYIPSAKIDLNSYDNSGWNSGGTTVGQQMQKFFRYIFSVDNAAMMAANLIYDNWVAYSAAVAADNSFTSSISIDNISLISPGEIKNINASNMSFSALPVFSFLFEQINKDNQHKNGLTDGIFQGVSDLTIGQTNKSIKEAYLLSTSENSGVVTTKTGPRDSLYYDWLTTQFIGGGSSEASYTNNATWQTNGCKFARYANFMKLLYDDIFTWPTQIKWS